jgi:hypothetical protein
MERYIDHWKNVSTIVGIKKVIIRIFLPFKPIQVSPIGISNFFTEWGFRMIVSELIWFFSCFGDWHYWCGIEAKIRKELIGLTLDQN